MTLRAGGWSTGGLLTRGAQAYTGTSAGIHWCARKLQFPIEFPLKCRNRLRLRTGRRGAGEDGGGGEVGSNTNRSVSVTELENGVLRISTRRTDNVARCIMEFQKMDGSMQKIAQARMKIVTEILFSIALIRSRRTRVMTMRLLKRRMTC